MKKTLLYALAAAFAIGGVVETAPLRAEEAGPAGARSLGEVRANMRGEAMTALQLGQLQEVRHRRWHKRRYVRRRGVFRSRTMSRIHHRGRWCGKYSGRRCYYTPRVLRPLRR